ncbi:MAG TPA: hypothetical protein PL110_06230 [Candidatus Eremiobacteraeota bacterium]|nr:MAG: hypothetical protein BWY64_01410 [bacterium ADurb.Bin363]HPZ07690.1 hypothetical protein [Candidatus Eremiobacteraeota bacterium]
MYKKSFLSIFLISSLILTTFVTAFAEDFKISNLKFGYAGKEEDQRKITEETTTIKAIGNYNFTVGEKIEKSTLIGISFDYEGAVEGVILRMRMPDTGNFYDSKGETVAENVNFYDYNLKFDKEKGSFIKTIGMLSDDPYGKYTFEIIYKDKVLESIEFNYGPADK